MNRAINSGMLLGNVRKRGGGGDQVSKFQQGLDLGIYPEGGGRESCTTLGY